MLGMKPQCHHVNGEKADSKVRCDESEQNLIDQRRCLEVFAHFFGALAIAVCHCDIFLGPNNKGTLFFKAKKLIERPHNTFRDRSALRICTEVS